MRSYRFRVSRTLNPTLNLVTADAALMHFVCLFAGTQHGDVLSLSGCGVQGRAGSDGLAKRGAHYYRVRVRVPVELSPEERSIMERLSALRL